MPDPHPPCCAPRRDGQIPPATRDVPIRASRGAQAHTMARIPAGSFLMGTDERGFPTDGEGPVREVALDAFEIDTCAVSNARFAAFVDATQYVTEAERYGWSFVFIGLLPPGFPPTRALAQAPWWRVVAGASWRRPEGAHSSTQGREGHPAVHISWNDAMAYCAWSGLRLPTEAEWERAARGGLVQRRFPWGDELTPGGQHQCNIWQGRFPTENTGDDGYLATAPVDAFPPNGYGLHNMAGNVWEWCADWFSASFHQAGQDAGPRRSPAGPPDGVARVIRGGSYLCHESYCNRYRVAARSSNTPDSSTGHTGFRCARDL